MKSLFNAEFAIRNLNLPKIVHIPKNECALFQKTGSLRQLNVQGSGFDFHFLYGKVVSESYLGKS